MTKYSIPLVNLERMHSQIKSDIINIISEIIDSNNFLKHQAIVDMEDTFSKINQSKYTIGCSSGTTALTLCLKACGIGGGDEVIVTSNTFFATAESIFHVNAKPVFCDVTEEDLNIDSGLIENLINNNTKAIIPVHIYGKPSKLDKISQICKKHNLILIEDCAQSHFAEYNDIKVGNFGIASAFSFYPGKNLGAMGDAGCITTNDANLYRDLIKLRDHGRSSKYEHTAIGYNYRIDSIQSAIINYKLKHILEWNEKRINLAKKYFEYLNGANNLNLFKYFDNNQKNIFHLFVVSHNNRDQIIKKLQDLGINCGIHYPIPLHQQPAILKLGYTQKKMPVIDKYCKEIFSLPICPYTKDEEVEYVCEKLIKIV